MYRHTSEYALAQGSDHFLVVLYLSALKSAQCAAVLLVDYDIMCHIDKTAGKITGVGCLKGGIGKTFARTVGTDEELKNGETFTEVCTNRNLDDLSARVRHEAAHTGKLTNLVG